MRLIHRTSPEEAARIVETGEWRSYEHPARVYFSTVSEGQGEGYGEAVLVVDLDESVCELDDEFPDGERHYAVPVQALAGVKVSRAS